MNAALRAKFAKGGTTVASDWPVTIVKGRPRGVRWGKYPWAGLVIWALFAGQDLWAHDWKGVVFLGMLSGVSLLFFALGCLARD